ncbi:Alpha/Beta hydrolase protein [Russula brevipes]|nr:Alpha/Beta hydrolase protein [Russula brevipes]
MVVFAFLFVPLSLIALVGASPHQPFSHPSSRDLCGALVPTPMGIAQGTTPINGVSRFAVKYASAQRWQDPVVTRVWKLPNGSSDPTMLPLSCPQSSLEPSQYSEDCLSMLLYAPATLALPILPQFPVFLWIHGGSFVRGSATAPGLDGTRLAKATGAIVVVVQYRLGALAWNSLDGRTNFAVKDVIASLQFLRTVLPSFGGNPSQITIAGQSSGANLIRALLATPSAAPLFQSAILHSDPMDYGFLSITVQSKLQQFFNSQINCSPADTSCIASLSLSAILSASDTLFNNAAGIDPAATQDEPMPGPTIYGWFTTPMDTSLYTAVVRSAFEEPRASNLLAFPGYQVPVLADGQTADARVQLEKMGTDQVWRCATWTFARNWIQNGGRAFVAQYTIGATYPDNQGNAFCSGTGVVCHEDDIEIVFGTVPNPTSAQSSLISEVQARYGSFLYSSNPNPSGSRFPQWSPATTGNFSAQNLGSPGTANIGACNTQFWGTTNVPYDYQVFGI